MSATYAWLLLLCFGCGLSAAVIQPGHGVAGPLVPPPMDLGKELMDIFAMVQLKPMNKMFARYLLNDGQFQAFVRIMNSNAGFMARWRLLSQPEVIMLRQWVNQQLMTSKGKFEIEEMEMCVTLFNRYPYMSGSVFGWQGFLNELEMYFPTYAIGATIQTKVQMQGIFAQFWTRVQALQVVYERWLAMPGTQTVLNQLQAEGIDNAQLDTLVRNLFGWNAVNGTTTAAPLLPMPTDQSGPVIMPGSALIL
ncbi:GH15258 [Drosophila grimshawi]|uniref:GH15258 n=2 Tax=Drosophila grimshawi TaxID=7222 RepID=B4IX36_DROGR|nr:GH15258 [Drosophila grimshawi]